MNTVIIFMLSFLEEISLERPLKSGVSNSNQCKSHILKNNLSDLTRTKKCLGVHKCAVDQCLNYNLKNYYDNASCIDTSGGSHAARWPRV